MLSLLTLASVVFSVLFASWGQEPRLFLGALALCWCGMVCVGSKQTEVEGDGGGSV